MKSVTINFDDDMLRSTGMTAAELTEAAKFILAARFYEEGRLDVGQAARLCDMDKAAFFNELPRRGYSFGNLGAEY